MEAVAHNVFLYQTPHPPSGRESGTETRLQWPTSWDWWAMGS